MAASFTKSRGGTASSFSRNQSFQPSPPSALHAEGIRRGPSGASFISSGIPDLDRILGGGFLLGSIVMIAEDPEAPHHLLLLRNFMSQGLVHNQPLLFASPSKDPRAFLGTLPGPMSSSQHSSGQERRVTASSHLGTDEKSLRIAWQYKKYFGEQLSPLNFDKVNMQEYSCDFDLRKPLDRQLLSSPQIECFSLLNTMNLSAVRDHCSKFLDQFTRLGGSIGQAGRIAIQSLCAPQCNYFDSEWEMLSFLRYLRAMIRSCNAVALVTFPCSVLTVSSYKRWQHLADTLLVIRAIPDEDKEMAKLLTGYQDMIGLLHINRVAQINTQVPVIPETSTYSLKLHKRRSLVLERLNQAPVDGSSGKADATDGSCSGSSRASPIDF